MGIYSYKTFTVMAPSASLTESVLTWIVNVIVICYYRSQHLKEFQKPTVVSSVLTCMTPPPVLLMRVCRNSSGRPIIFPSQFITTVSSSVQAGLDAWNKQAFVLIGFLQNSTAFLTQNKTGISLGCFIDVRKDFWSTR